MEDNDWVAILPDEVVRALGRESPHDKFRRLAEARVNKAIDKITLVGNLASRNYKFTIDDVESIRVQLQNALDATMARFRKKRKEGIKPFSLRRDRHGRTSLKCAFGAVLLVAGTMSAPVAIALAALLAALTIAKG